MHIRFFPDGRTAAGGGHVSRCLAVAQCARVLGATVDFVMLNPAPSAIRAIGAAGFEASRNAAGVADWGVVDSYIVDCAAEDALRDAGMRLMVFEDVPGRNHSCDILVDVNADPETSSVYDDLIPKTSGLILGPRFAPLRASFAEARDAARAQREHSPYQVWIFFGRVDAQGYTRKVLEAFADPRLAGCCIAHAVIGESLANAQDVRRIAAGLPNVQIHDEVADMAGFLSDMDLAVCAAGVGLWEVCCLGIASLSIAVVENQARALATATRLGATRGEPALSWASSLEIADKIVAMLDSRSDRTSISAHARQAVDGRGASRLAALLNGLSVRDADENDADLLWRWANDPVVRRNAINQGQIPWPDHVAWFTSKLDNPDSHIFVGLMGDVPVGQVRFDRNRSAGVAEIDISIAPDQRGKGLGASLLLHAEAAWRRRCYNGKLIARVKRTNSASLAMFASAGYSSTDTSASDELAVVSA